MRKRIYIVYLIIVVLLSSCGSRKTIHQKEVTKETTTTDAAIVDKSKVEVTADLNVKVIDSSKSDEITITPFDNTKEMVVDGKKYFNSVLKRKKVNNNKVVEVKKKVQVVALNDIKTTTKAKTDTSTKSKGKETVRSGFNFGNFVLLLSFVGIAGFIIYWFFWIRNKKSKINDVV